MNDALCSTITNCRLCGCLLLHKIVELQATPAGNNFLTKLQISEGQEPTFPLELLACEECSHIQLGHSVHPDFLFSNNYHFVSGTSEVNVKHFKEYANQITRLEKLQKGSSIFDIGSNDGTCLRQFQELGMNVLGIDPAKNIAEIANEQGVPTICGFFTEETISKISRIVGRPDLITSHNVFAHIRELRDTLNLVKKLLTDDNLFVFEVGYFVDVFNNLWFDTIYHEHLDYHTVIPLNLFFANNGMELFNVEKVSMQGGSIRCYVQREGGSRKLSSNVTTFIDDENTQGFTDLDHLKTFQKRIDYNKNKLLELLKSLKAHGQRVAGYGAPTKSTTLLSYFEITREYLDYIIDDNPLKQDKFTPQTHIPVVNNEILSTNEQPDYLLILAWNFSESIMEGIRKKGIFHGKFIIPLPNIEVR